jgi:hypothetical protein
LALYTVDRSRPLRKLQLTARDLELLSFVAEHRLVLADHVQALLEASAGASDPRLRSLTNAGYLAKEAVFHRQPPCYHITRKGLAAIGSAYSEPRIDLSCYAHDVGIAWLWLAARSGVWGPTREIISERQLRSHDAAPDRTGEPMGVRLGGLGPRGKPRLHYPDLLLITLGDHRVALELELTSKPRGRREKILAGYAADSRIDALVYLVEHSSTGRSVEATARRFGIENLLEVQEIRWGAGGKPGRGARSLGQSVARTRSAHQLGAGAGALAGRRALAGRGAGAGGGGGPGRGAGAGRTVGAGTGAGPRSETLREAGR